MQRSPFQADANMLSEEMDTREVCRYFHIVPKTLLKWRNRQNFPAPTRRGSKNFYLRSEIQKWSELTGGGRYFHHVRNGYKSEFSAFLAERNNAKV